MNLHMAEGARGEGRRCKRVQWGAQLRTQVVVHPQDLLGHL